MELTLVNVIWLDQSGRLRKGEVAVRGQRIHRAVGSVVDWQWPGAPGPAARTPFPTLKMGRIEGQGRLLCLPGIIDSHVHFRQPGDAWKEGIANGSRAALRGGVTTVLDMPNNRPPCTTRRRLEHKRKLFARLCRVNWGLHVQAVPGSGAALAGVASAKIYMPRSSSLPGVTGVDALRKVLGNWPLITLHAEDENLFEPEARFHDEQRPLAAVASALNMVERALRSLPPGSRPKLVLCHIASRLEVDWLRRMRHEGFPVHGETCPHYCLLTREDARNSGGRLKVNPPLRTADDRVAVLAALADGLIDFLSTDHAPHGAREKTAGRNATSGIPGIEWFGPVALHLVRSGIINWQHYFELTCAGPCRCFGLTARNGIIPGNFADLALYDLSGRPVPGEITTRAGYNPFTHTELPAGPVATIVNGSPQHLAGQFPGDAAGQEVLQ